jgi:hypothetical protein
LAKGAAGGGTHYSGTGAGAGGFVNKTGFVKERTNTEDHMDGKTEPAKDEANEKVDGDVPDNADANEDTDAMKEEELSK